MANNNTPNNMTDSITAINNYNTACNTIINGDFSTLSSSIERLNKLERDNFELKKILVSAKLMLPTMEDFFNLSIEDKRENLKFIKYTDWGESDEFKVYMLLNEDELNNVEEDEHKFSYDSTMYYLL